MKKLLYITIPSLLFVSLLYLFVHYPGYVKLNWFDYKISMSIATFLISSSAIILMIYYTIRLIVNIFNLPQTIRTYYNEKSIKEHLNLLEQGMSSLISQDQKSLEKYTKKLNSNYTHSINLFFQAELSVLTSEYNKASSLFKELTNSKNMAFTGYYGLMRVAILQKHNMDAIKWGHKALSHYNKSIVIRKRIIDILIEEKEYNKALNELNNLEKQKYSDFVLYKKELVLFKIANNLYQQKKLKESLEYLHKLLSINPSLQKALTLYLAIAKQLNLIKKAIKAIETAWQHKQNDEIAELYFEVKNTKTDIEKFQAVQKLSGFLSDSSDSFLINAKFAIKAQLWDEAKKYLNALINKKVYMEQAYNLMSTIESHSSNKTKEKK